MSLPEPDRERSPDAVEEYAGGEIRVRRGSVNRWLLVVYLLLFVWGVYYLFADWGGLGPGLGR
jgi:hypothetical protein